MSEEDINLEQSKLISVAFEKFNKTLLDFRKFQIHLEDQISDLQGELSIKNEELRSILESLPSGLIVINRHSEIISYNNSAAKITGYSIEEAQKLGLNKMLRVELIPDDLLKNDTKLALEDKSVEFVYTQPQGRKLYLEARSSTMSSTATKETLGVIINLQDISLLKSLQQATERQNRLIAMGQIAASVAHEIRNPLGGMELFVSVLKKDLAGHKEHSEAITHIQSAMKSMNHIISNILEFTRPKQVNYEKLDLVKLVNQFIAFNQLYSKYQNIKITKEFSVKKAEIYGNSEQLKQVLQNIYMNALQAIESGGELCLKISYASDAQVKELSPEFGLAPILLQIIDSGEGMEQEVLSRIFDPFFTTKQKGTGLGLSIVKQVIETHHGQISIASSPAGTVVSIYFPSIEQAIKMQNLL